MPIATQYITLDPNKIAHLSGRRRLALINASMSASKLAGMLESLDSYHPRRGFVLKELSQLLSGIRPYIIDDEIDEDTRIETLGRGA
jgi:hypothetical protein